MSKKATQKERVAANVNVLAKSVRKGDWSDATLIANTIAAECDELETQEPSKGNPKNSMDKSPSLCFCGKLATSYAENHPQSEFLCTPHWNEWVK